MVRRGGCAEAETAGLPLLETDDPAVGLQEMASCYRQRFSIPLVAVTGSNGKTTTKDMIAHLLSSRAPTVSSPRSYNNFIGLPLTLTGIDSGTRFGVVEIGTNRPGEVAALARIARPTVGVVTNVGPSHLEGLGSVEGVAREKGALVAHLPAGGVAVLNGDDPWCRRIGSKSPVPVRWIGFGEGVDLKGEDLCQAPDGLIFKVGGQRVHLPIWGEHQAYNVLSALAVAEELGFPIREALPVLEGFRLPVGRLCRYPVGSIELLDDHYNANPSSCAAALELLRSLPCQGRRWAVLGEMAELGVSSPALHRALGERVARGGGIFAFWGVGSKMKESLEGAREAVGGADGGSLETRWFPDSRQAADALVGALREGDLVLVKGSRVMKMENVIDGIRRRYIG
jgi:UDP-N-acetylmuramoyl-tripeptide--D-alanyl-D-alanine ligase